MPTFSKTPTAILKATSTDDITPIGPADGLVAYYPFDGNALDKSGFGNDGEIHDATLTTDRNGKPDSAFAFNGMDSYISVESDASLNFTTKLTMSAWIKTSGTVPFASILFKAPENEPRNGYGLCIDDNRKLRADIHWDHSQSIGVVLQSETNITDGEWHFVAATYDGETANLYIDGNLVETEAYQQGTQKNQEPLLIGWDQSTWLSDRHFEGVIDDVRLYNRALSLQELQELMALPTGSTPTTIPSPTPVAGQVLIAFASGIEDQNAIYTMSTDGSNVRQLTDSAFDSHSPAWSPEGQWIVFSSNRNGNYQIYKMKWDGSEVTQLTNGSRDAYRPTWSPDGLTIAYALRYRTNDLEYNQIYMTSPAGGEGKRISNSMQGEANVTWAPDSTWFTYTVCYPAGEKPCEILRMNMDGTDQINLTNDYTSQICPALSPDGKMIAFVEWGNGRDLYFMDADTLYRHPLLTDGYNELYPSWSPDSTKLVFVSNRDSNDDIWMIDIYTKELQQLTATSASENSPVWQPNIWPKD